MRGVLATSGWGHLMASAGEYFPNWGTQIHGTVILVGGLEHEWIMTFHILGSS